MNFDIGIGCNIRQSPYFQATVDDGVKAFSVYNHMYIPAHFGDPVGEYQRLVNGVAQWDVGAQRQVQLQGPDAGRLVRYLVTRNLEKMPVGQGYYVVVCDYDGNLINDPVLLKLSEDCFWLSIADSDISLWAEAVGRERGLDVTVTEPDVSPMAIQGPLAEPLAIDLFGAGAGKLRYFGFVETSLQGIPLVLARSGWSRQGGFELYLRDGSRGGELWDIVRRAGEKYGIGPGAPNDVERIESGLLSYGADARLQENPCNPFELGLDRLVALDRADDFIGRQALAAIRQAGISRVRTGFEIDGEPVAQNRTHVAVTRNGERVGTVTEMVHSPRLGRNIGVGMIAHPTDDIADGLELVVGEETRRGRLAALPFIGG